jgi:hypothetical protein
MVPSVVTEKIPSVTPLGIDPETVRLVAHYYATPDPVYCAVRTESVNKIQVHVCY